MILSCKFYNEYKRCKFDPCAYKHIEHDDDDIEKLKKENELLVVKIRKMEIDVEQLMQKETETVEIIEKLRKREEKLDILGKESSVKDVKIDKLDMDLKDANLKAFEQDKKIDLLSKKFSVLREKESNLQEKVESLLVKVDEMSVTIKVNKREA